ncbi:MAG: methyltransferase domain-containing protein [Candidatus Marinimicrobia bacterium]|nr:methyltransferase domain-containing protein [Candidatus Neomarinimicrobiota bacterium]
MTFKEDNSQFWEDIYLEDDAGWDLGGPTPIFESMADSMSPGELCIIGCGKGYDAIMFAQKGFDVTAVDFASSAINALEELANENDVNIQIVQKDIFSLTPEHINTFDYIIEQTCFCAINPSRRKGYEQLVRKILKPGGKLIGLWFPLDKHPDEEGPPFGTTLKEVKSLFDNGWKIVKEEFPDLSIEPRKGREKLIIFKKN